MKSAYVHVRVKAEEKAAAEKILESVGLDMSTAVNLFLRKIVIRGGLPFDVVDDDYAMKYALATLKMEGLEPAPEDLDLLKEYDGSKEKGEKLIRYFTEKYKK